MINKDIYKTYIDLCKKEEVKAASYTEIDDIIRKMVIVLEKNKQNHMLIKITENVKIDAKGIYLYIEIRDKNVVINFWNELQRKLLFKED